MEQQETGLQIKQDNELQVAPKAAAAIAETQALFWMASQNPRNWQVAWGKLMEQCKRKTLAEKANYSFPRGGSTVTGPSVYLARAAATCYGRILVRTEVLRDDDESMLVQATAMDIETLTIFSAQDSFRKLIYRKQGGWIKPDERDLRELKNRREAILVRNCILQVIPRDLIEDAQAVCRQTLKSGIKDPKAAAKEIILRFSEYGVDVEALNEYVGNDSWDAETIVELQGILNALKDGTASLKDYFGKKPETPEVNNGSIDLKNLKAGDPSTHQDYEPLKDKDPEAGTTTELPLGGGTPKKGKAGF